MLKPEVSIIMGVYKEKKEFLRRSIESILNQSYSSWEFIICDDGSEDGTYEYLLQLSESDKRFIVMKNEKNIGLAPTLNRCINVSRGKYVARMDSDDIARYDRFEKQINVFQFRPELDIVGSGANLIDSNGIWGKRLPKSQPEKKDFLWGTQFIHPSVMMKRETLIQNGSYRVAKETLRTEDYDLFMRMYANGSMGFNIQDTLLDYTESRASYAKRKFKFRVNEAIVRYKGFSSLKLMPLGYVYIFKPILVGLIPGGLLRVVKRKTS